LIRRPFLLPLTAALAACSTPAAGPSDASTSSASTTAPPAVTAAASTSTSAAAATPATTSATAAASAEPAPPASAEPSASAAASAAPVPAIKVTNIGMHIGGGPHDAVTKAPIKQSVEPHFDELKRCWTLVDDPKKGGDFGLDLLIDRAGGKAKITNPRTSLKGKGFKECLITAFEAIDFKKPRGGTTTVSYSVRFSP
jgi:pyruvate/2-oxoglutarate dehydrogenase complex dihydrolipoamide acyltransferase (E2) component